MKIGVFCSFPMFSLFVYAVAEWGCWWTGRRRRRWQWRSSIPLRPKTVLKMSRKNAACIRCVSLIQSDLKRGRIMDVKHSRLRHMAGTKTYRTFVRFYMCLPKIISMLKTQTGIYVKTLMLLNNSLYIQHHGMYSYCIINRCSKKITFYTWKWFSFFLYLFADPQPRKHCALLWPSNRGLDCVPFPRILHRRRAVRPNWWDIRLH